MEFLLASNHNLAIIKYIYFSI